MKAKSKLVLFLLTIVFITGCSTPVMTHERFKHLHDIDLTHLSYTAKEVSLTLRESLSDKDYRLSADLALWVHQTSSPDFLHDMIDVAVESISGNALPIALAHAARYDSCNRSLYRNFALEDIESYFKRSKPDAPDRDQLMLIQSAIEKQWDVYIKYVSDSEISCNAAYEHIKQDYENDKKSMDFWHGIFHKAVPGDFGCEKKDAS